MLLKFLNIILILLMMLFVISVRADVLCVHKDSIPMFQGVGADKQKAWESMVFQCFEAMEKDFYEREQKSPDGEQVKYFIKRCASKKCGEYLDLGDES